MFNWPTKHDLLMQKLDAQQNAIANIGFKVIHIDTLLTTICNNPKGLLSVIFQELKDMSADIDAAKAALVKLAADFKAKLDAEDAKLAAAALQAAADAAALADAQAKLADAQAQVANASTHDEVQSLTDQINALDATVA